MFKQGLELLRTQILPPKINSALIKQQQYLVQSQLPTQWWFQGEGINTWQSACGRISDLLNYSAKPERILKAV